MESRLLKTYESIFILDSRKLDDGGETFAKQVANLVEQLGGTVQKSVSLGRRQFARPIGRHRAGVYWDFIVDLEPEQVETLKDRYRLNNTVLRLEAFLFEKGSDPAQFASS